MRPVTMATGRRLATLLLVVVAVVACVKVATTDPLEPDMTVPPVVASTTTSLSATASSTTAPTSTTTATGPPAATDPLTGLIVAEEHLPGYDRDLFDHWSDADHDRCNTRCEVLEAERRPDVGWVSIYDGFVTTDPSKVEIDHVVALAEAWRSGAWSWDDARREAFANDLDEPDALIAVSSASNQSKADKDPAEWRPPNRGAWCQWAKGWTRTKVKWGLSADPREVEALHTILADC